jgi:orotidine-5'-phosphate decarboxylase
MTGPRVAVALDYPAAKEALALVDRLSPDQCRLKVGLELFCAAGPALVQTLVRRGFDVFLDLKFHDIPNTAAAACRQAADLGVWMLTVHCLGGRAMLRAAREALGAGPRPLVVGVTVLTSHTADEVAEIGLAGDIPGRVGTLAALAKECGLDGVVCAPTEVQALRTHLGAAFFLVTPGVRPAGAAVGDQRRVLTPAEAIARGSDMLVIGRPITEAPDPCAALTAIVRDLPASG